MRTSKKYGFARGLQSGQNGTFLEWKISYKKKKIRMEKYEFKI